MRNKNFWRTVKPFLTNNGCISDDFICIGIENEGNLICNNEQELVELFIEYYNSYRSQIAVLEKSSAGKKPLFFTNKISLNSSKTEILIFRPKGKSITKHLNFRISGEKINTSSTVNYLGVLLHENLQWQTHIDSLITKLSTAVGLLSKIRYYVPKYRYL